MSLGARLKRALFILLLLGGRGYGAPPTLCHYGQVETVTSALERIMADFRFDAYDRGADARFNLPPEAAARSAKARQDLFWLYEGATDRPAFKARVLALAKDKGLAGAVGHFLDLCTGTTLLRGMGEGEVATIAATGQVVNRTGFGTFATAGDSAAYTAVQDYNVRMPGITAEPLGNFRVEGGAVMKFKGIMSTAEREAIALHLKAANPTVEGAKIDAKINALYNQSQGGRDREYLLFFKAPRFFFEPATYDFSVADQGAVIPSYDYMRELQKAGGGKELTRDDYDKFLAVSKKADPTTDISAEIKREIPHVGDRLAIVMNYSHDHHAGIFSARYLDVEKTLTTNKPRLRPEAYANLLKQMAKLAGVTTPDATEAQVIEAWKAKSYPGGV